MLYEPREDSGLLRKYVKKYSHGIVLDMGTGTGIQAVEASKNKNVTKVIAVDISNEAIDYCKRNIKNKKISFKVSDMFSNITGKFNTILFNPPYLPKLKGENDISLSASKHGYETISKFLKQSKKYLKTNGIILLIFSSITNKKKVDSLIKKNNMNFEELEHISFFFEKIYCYRIKQNLLNSY